MIDWTATGSMLTGIATLTGSGAIVYAAWLGKSTFDDWRRQRQEDRRIDAAEKIMTLAYRLKDDLESVRSPMIRGFEIQAAEEELKAVDNWWNGLTDWQKNQAASAHARMMRMRRFKPDWDEIWDLKPLALAYFGTAVDEPLHTFWKTHVEVMLAVEELRDEKSDGDRDREHLRMLRSKVSSAANPDEVDSRIKAAVRDLERELFPVLRADFSAAPPLTAAAEAPTGLPA